MKLKVWVAIDDRADKEIAVVEALLIKVLGAEIHWCMCPPGVRELYRMPFLADENGSRRFGIDDITRFVREQLR